MKPYTRMMMLLVGVLATAFVLQGAFDLSDHQKSERIVQSYRGAGPAAVPSLGERLATRAPGGVWTSEITHGCRGFVRVSYAAPSGTWSFDYDVPEHRIHPASPEAERLLAELPAAAPPPR